MGYLTDPDVTLHHGDALELLAGMPASSADAVVTSPPYLDARPEYPSPTEDEFVATFWELRRVCRGGMALNVGRLFRDGREIPLGRQMLDLVERAGWAHVDTIVWAKPNANPIIGPVVTNAHEYVFLCGHVDDFDENAIRLEYARGTAERMRRRFVSSVSVKGDTSERNGARRDEKRGMHLETNPAGARPQSVFVAPVGREKGNPHPAPMPLELAELLVSVCRGSVIVDPYAGSGTTALAARARGKTSILVERDLGFCELAASRLRQQGLFVS